VLGTAIIAFFMFFTCAILAALLITQDFTVCWVIVGIITAAVLAERIRNGYTQNGI
jgi:multisubunit Na+/H+ antiporter MnhE subunit